MSQRNTINHRNLHKLLIKGHEQIERLSHCFKIVQEAADTYEQKRVCQEMSNREEKEEKK